MCGRYASVASRAELLERFVVAEQDADELRGQDFNVTPTKDNPVVIARVPKDPGEDADPVRELRTFRWGLLPFWAKDIKVGAKMINARAETVHEKPAYRRAFKAQRALIPVDAFYEWLETDQVGKSGKKLKQPFALRPSDGSTLALAGLYEVWYDKSLPKDDPNAKVPTYTIITTTATDSVGRIHDRMPMAITPDNWDKWLDPRNHDVDQLRELMAPPVDGSLDMYAVSKLVNNVKNNGPELLAPVPAEH
ncbi:SOS response-associated peptidase [Kribbella sp. NPDC049174]|uniref:SOS response-associated peptidase n=1 Tax=Kribbella sp. NPDC049174 TaxID=3364112 RepID=UPI003721C1D0